MTLKGLAYEIAAWLIIVGVVATVGAILVGLYFLDHYRWGCTP